MRRSLFGLMALILLLPTMAIAQSQKMCTEKVLDTGMVEGLYGGVICGDFCHVSIRLDNGEEFSLIEGPADAEKLFDKIGNRVSATYELQQFWNEFGGECARTEVLKSGKIIKVAQPAKPPTMVAPASTQFKLGTYVVCLENTNNGEDCLKPNNTGVGFLRNFEANQTGSDTSGPYEDQTHAFAWQRNGSTLTLSFQNGKEKQCTIVKDNLLFEGGTYYLFQESESYGEWDQQPAAEEKSVPQTQANHQAQANQIGLAIKGFQLGMTETQFLEVAKRNFPHVFKAELPLAGERIMIYVMTYQDPQEPLGIVGLGPMSPAKAIAMLVNTLNGDYPDSDKQAAFRLVVNSLGTVASMAFFSTDDDLLTRLWFTGPHLHPLFNVSPSPSKPFLQAFVNAYGLSLEPANDHQYTYNPPDFSWLLTISLQGAGIQSISMERKNARFD